VVASQALAWPAAAPLGPRRWLALLAGLVALLGPPRSALAARLVADLDYVAEGEPSGPLQRLDLYLPDATPPPGGYPLVVFVHGGAWSSGDKAQYRALGEYVAAAGAAVAAINYRLSPAVRHPAHAQDVARATAWLVRHAADYDLDTGRIFLMGHSAGAQLATLVALDARYLEAEGLAPSALRGVVAIAGDAYDLQATDGANSPIGVLLLSVFGPDRARWLEAAAQRYARPDAPPFLVIHGADDRVARPAASRAFADALQAAGADVRYVEVPDRDHLTILFGLGDPADPAAQALREFLRQ
jgi:acetyl esterase/lipase